MRVLKKLQLFIIAGLFAVMVFAMTNVSTKALTYAGLGDVEFEWDREIYDGVNLRHTMSYNRNKEQKTYTIHFDPKTTALKPVVTTGPGVMYGNTMSSLVSQYEKQGHHVVFGINGDGYDTSNGVPAGIGINDGILLNTSTDKHGWGITADGQVKYGRAKLPMSLTIAGGETIQLTDVNKERKMDTNGLYLLTEDFNATTDSTQAGVEVILSVDEGQDGLRIGQPYNVTVEKIEHVENNPGKNKTRIDTNKVVLATHVLSDHYNTISNLQQGQKIVINIDDNDDERIDWSEIVAGMGIFHLLLDNGKETGNLANQDVHPRSAMGIKADGSIILMQNDGRQVGWANGFTFREMVEYMRDELGAVTVFNFDGGGSSTISATLPGDERATVLNRPSDGQERSNSNAFLLIATEEPTPEKEVEKIHIYPSLQDNYATKGMILEGAKMSFYVTATDKNYYPVQINGGITYRIENTVGNIGEIDETGNFTAVRGTGKGKVIASYDGKEASFDIEVVNSISKIETERTIISVAPLGTTQLEFRAFKDGIPIIMTTDSLDFKVTPVDIATVSPNGQFRALKQSGSGQLEVSYKTYKLTMPIEIGRLPEMIADFERDVFADNSWTKHFINIPNNGGDGDISVNFDERYVKHGDGSLRIDYDFATRPLSGTVAIEVSEHGGTVLEGQPTAIGAWVYGDGQGGWFRIQLTGGKYAGDTRIDWVGWRYIETPIPTDAPYPYTVQKMIRLLGTPTIANNVAGTIYVDSVRVVYDYKNDDNNEPVILEDTISPKQGTTTSDRLQEISLTVKDSPIEPVTGIDTSRTQIYINNKLVENIIQSVNPDGSVNISYKPGHLDRLRPGVQNVRVRVEDNFGNKKFVEWSFILEGYAVHLNEDKPDKDVIYAGEEFAYIIDTASYRDFDQVEIDLSYNSDSLELLEHNVDERLYKVKEEVNPITGQISYILQGMRNHDKGDATLFEFKFKAKDIVDGTTAIKVTKSTIIENDEEVDLVLEGYDVEFEYKYLLKAFGTTKDRHTEFTLTEKQVGVEGISLIAYTGGTLVELPDSAEFLTSSDGIIYTDFFTNYSVGTKFLIHAIKDGLLSNRIEIEVLASLGSKTPEKVVVTVGEEASREVGVSFQTNHDVTDGKVWIANNENLEDAREILATPKIIFTVHNKQDHEYTAWGAFVKELEPDTRYYYQVGSDEVKSEIFTFKTPKESGDLNMAYYGDIQGGYNTFGNIQGRLNSRYPDVDLNMIAGDVADNGHIYANWTDLDTYNKQYFNNGIWSSTVGNHDATDEAWAFTSYFYGPTNGVENEYGARNYWFNFGDAVIFNFDTEAGFNSYDPHYTKQIALLEEVMNNTTKTFKIVNMHRSAYPLNYNEVNIRNLAKTFDKLNIDLVLSGHDHTYNRVTMKDGVKQDGVHGGPTYIVGGTASGAKYYDGDDSRPWVGVAYDDNNPIYMMFKFRDGNRIEYEAYAVEGGNDVLIDSFTIEKNNVNVEEENFEYDGPNNFISGSKVEFSIKADEGYYVDKVFVNGVLVNYNSEGVYVIENANENLNITVELKTGYNKYDLNGDSVITKEDAIAILRHITGKEELSLQYITLLGLTEDDLTLEYAREILEMVGGNQ